VQGRRFAATLGELTGGRVGLTCGSVGVLKGAVTIAIRYSAGRQQFGPPDSAEVQHIFYICMARAASMLALIAASIDNHFLGSIIIFWDRYVVLAAAAMVLAGVTV
jgi:acyl-CoA oxidase